MSARSTSARDQSSSAGATGAAGTALFFGPHPDDVELFAGGTAARLRRLGHRVVICDLSRGELASNGTPELRAFEAAAAARILGAERIGLDLPDGGLCATDDAQVRALASVVRQVRPQVVFAPAARGRHPDHEAACQLVRQAVFFANLRNAPIPGERHRVDVTMHYLCRVAVRPNVLVPLAPEDVSAKREAIAAHASQVGAGRASAAGALVAEGPLHATLVGRADLFDALAARDGYWGGHAGVAAAEPFVRTRLHVEDDPVAWALAHPSDGVHWFDEGDG